MSTLAETLAPVAAKRMRLESIDVVRGVIMILMALDHTRDFFGNSGLNPTNPATTTVPLFFTRWVTHFCAPIFFLLTGTGAFLARRRLGFGLTAAFFVLRAINVYGDPSRWSTQKSAAFTVLSFLNTTKYPPSLLYLLMTIGPATLFLWAVDGGTPGWLRPALIFGKVPMFYYLLHIPLIHLLGVAVCYARYRHVYWMFQSPNLGDFPVTQPPGWGYSLPVVYLVWIVVVVALYPLCHWFAGVRQRRSDTWLSYF